MPNQYGQYELTDGSLRFELFLSLMGKGQASFVLGNERITSKLDLNVTALMREDGSGHCWLFEGAKNKSVFGEQNRLYQGFYRTNSHVGYAEPQKSQLFKIDDHDALALVNGPCFEDFFRSLTDGDNGHRLTVRMTRSGKTQNNEGEYCIEGIRKSHIPNSWEFLASEVNPFDKSHKWIRVCGIYSTQTREGWFSYVV